MRLTAYVLGSLAAAVAAPASAQTPSERPQVFEQLVACRDITDATRRLACFDAQVGALAAAEAKKDVVIVDRAQVRKARRSLFGLTLPKLRLFGDDEEANEPEFTTLEAKIKEARPAANGWAFTLDDGARWVQTDGQPLARAPKPGQPIRIRKAAMGSFLANVDRQIAIRVRRVN